MFKFSSKSLDNLVGVHPELVDIVHDVMALQVMDFSVIEGLRSVEQQEIYVQQGRSRTMNSKHLKQDTGYSHAVDLYPYPIDMKLVNRGDMREISRFGMLAGLMLSCAKQRGITLTWGADWDRDGVVLDHTFYDAPHFQIEL